MAYLCLNYALSMSRSFKNDTREMLEISERDGLIQRLGNKKAKGMKKAKGNGINGLFGQACRYQNQIILSAQGLCRSLLLFQPRGVYFLSVQLNSGGEEKLYLLD